MKTLRYLEHAPVLKLDQKLCTGCGICADICPHRVFVINTKAEIQDPGGCMECGACAMNCPVHAIYVNPDDGCGCAALIINSWITKITGKPSRGCC